MDRSEAEQRGLTRVVGVGASTGDLDALLSLDIGLPVAWSSSNCDVASLRARWTASPISLVRCATPVSNRTVALEVASVRRPRGSV